MEVFCGLLVSQKSLSRKHKVQEPQGGGKVNTMTLHSVRLVGKYVQVSSVSAKIHLKANAVAFSKKKKMF